MLNLLAIRTALKALPWRWIAPALAVAGLLFAVYGAGVKRERARLTPKIEAAQRERDIARLNADAFNAALGKATAAAERAGKQTAAAQDRAAEAARTAQERGKALVGVRARLDAATRPVAPVAGCETPAAVLELDRKL